MKKRAISMLSLIVGLAIIGSILKIAGVQEVYGSLLKIDRAGIFYILITQAMLTVMFAWRWRTFISSVGKNTRFTNVIMVSTIGYLMNCITPGAKAGGEPARAYLLGKLERMKATKCFATIMAERLYDISTYMLLILLGLVLIYKTAELTIIENILLWSGAIIVIILIWTALNISIDKDKSKNILKAILRILRNIKPLASRVNEWSKKIDESIDEYSTTFKNAMLQNVMSGVFLSMVMRALELLRLYLVAMALGAELGFVQILSVYVIIMLAYLVPSPPAGLGVIDLIYVVAFKLAGVSTATAAAIMLVDRFFSTLFPALLGLTSAYYVGFKKMDGFSVKKQ